MFRRRTNVYTQKIPKYMTVYILVYTRNDQEKNIYKKLVLEKLKTEMEILSNRREHSANSIDTIDKEIKQFLDKKCIPESLGREVVSDGKKRKNGSHNHRTSHADCEKFILMLTVSFFSCHKCRKIVLCVSFLLFFHSKDIDLFTLSRLIPLMTLLC